MAGWFSNSKYALLGALRGVAQTISYEVRFAIILITPLILHTTFNISLFLTSKTLKFTLVLPLILL